MYRRMTTRMKAEFTSETKDAKDNGKKIFKVQKGGKIDEVELYTCNRNIPQK